MGDGTCGFLLESQETVPSLIDTQEQIGVKYLQNSNLLMLFS
jgi:hypothetical protein